MQNYKKRYVITAGLIIGVMTFMALKSWQDTISSQKMDQEMSQKVSRENAAIPGPKGNKRPKSVPETSGKSFAAATSVTASELKKSPLRN